MVATPLPLYAMQNKMQTISTLNSLYVGIACQRISTHLHKYNKTFQILIDRPIYL